MQIHNFKKMNRVGFLILLAFFLFPNSFHSKAQEASEHPASFVWCDEEVEERNQMAYFRQEISVGSEIEKAELNVCADSRYLLYINGTPISFGPVRYFPENPRYDHYELSDYLQEGENVIAVKVYSNGTNTYQMPLSKAGFVAWGDIVSNESSVSLLTPGSWKALRSEALLQEAPKMSFATGPMEIHDGNEVPAGWMKAGFDDSNWDRPFVLKNQDYWGEMQPRSIPFLTHDERIARELLWKRTISQEEEVLSFRVKSADRTRGQFNTQKRAFAYTYVYSPEKQSVDIGVWWGEHFLNGEGPLEREETTGERINREILTLNLEKGWNFYFVKYDIVWASWEAYFSVPSDAGLIFSANKNKNPDVYFRTAGPFSGEEEEEVLALDLPFESPGDLPELSAGWVDKGADDAARNPAWNVAWSEFKETLPSSPHQVRDIEIEANQPVALAFETGGKQLGRIFVEYEAPEGTRFEMGFSEDLLDDRPWVLKRAGIYTGVGHVASGKTKRFESFKPYGLRYLQLNVSGHTEDVTIKKIGVISQKYPFELKGEFSGSEPIYNDLWSLGWRTLEVCAEDTYTDTPFRERGLYAGDALPQYGITLATTGDSRLIKQSLLVFQGHYREFFKPQADKQEDTPGTLGDFPLKTLEYFRWSVQYTDDLDFARRLYQPYKNLIETYRALETYRGLVVFPRIFLEWTQIEKSNVANTAANALMVRSYRNMAWIARELGENADARMYQKYADELTANILAHCWDKDKGAFHDGFKNGEKLDSHYPISSAYPVLFGLTNEDHHESLKPFFARKLADIGDVSRQRQSTPYGGFYVLGALYKIGEAATAENFISKYYSPMIHKYNDTAWENFDDGSGASGQGTLSHAWSGAPTFYMSTQALGVPLYFLDMNPDDEVLTIAPQSEILNHAEGAVPRPEGLVHVKWKIEGDILFFDVKAPEGVKWEVKPRGRLAEKELVVNGNHLGKQ